MLSSLLQLYSPTLETLLEPCPVRVTPQTPVLEVLAQMQPTALPPNIDSLTLDPANSCPLITSYALIVEDNQFIGIFTERRLLQFVAAATDLETMTIDQVMLSSIPTLSPADYQDIFTPLSILRQHHLQHLPVIDDQGQILGVITLETLRHHLQPANLLKCRVIEEVMTTETVTAPPSTSITALANLMTQTHVSSVIICDQRSEQQIPVGILTERDIVQFHLLGLSLDQTPAQEVMSYPLFTISPQATLITAQQQMQQYRVRHLVVTGTQGELLGIVTQTNLLQTFDLIELYGVIELLQQQVADLESEKAQLVANRHQELEKQVQQRTQALQAQAQCDHLLASIANRTRQLINLEDILNATVTEVRHLLQCSRVIIYRLQSDQGGTVLVESAEPGRSSMLHHHIFDPCFSSQSCLEAYTKGRISILENAATENLADCYLQLLRQFEVQANLVTPILQGEQLWGLLVAQNCDKPRRWHAFEVELLQELATQLSIAIQQAELYHRLQDELNERKRAEAALERERNFVTTVLNMAGALVVVLDRQARIISFNQTCEQITGYKFAEVKNQPFWDLFIPPEEQASVRSGFHNLLITGKFPDQYENYWVARNGGRHLIAWSNTGLVDADNQVEYIISTGIDITEQRKAEAEITSRIQQQATLASLGQEALAATDLEPLMQLTALLATRTLNLKFCAILELLPNQTVFRLVAGVGWEKHQIGNALISAGSQSQPGYTLQASQPVIVEDLRIETRFGGSPLLHNHHIISGMSVIIPGKNTLFGVLSVHSDESRKFTSDEVDFLQTIANLLAIAIERKHTEEELNHFFNLSLDLFCIASLDGYFKRVNPRFAVALGYTYEELMNLPFLDLVHPDDLGATKQEMHKLAAGIPSVDFENRYRSKTNTYYWFSWTAIPATDRIFYAVARDITERKKSEEAIRNIALGVSAVTGDVFFQSLVQYLAKALEVEYAFVAEWHPEQKNLLKTVAACAKGEIIDNFEYCCMNTPCETIIQQQKLCVYADSVQTYYPQDHLLVEMQIESYLGIPLVDSVGQCLGLISVMSHKSLTDTRLMEEILQIFAVRATSELERRQAEATLHQLNQELETRVELRTTELREANQLLQTEIKERLEIEAELKTRERKQTIIAELGQQALSGMDLYQLIQQVIHRTALGLNVEYCNVWQLSPEAQSLLRLTKPDTNSENILGIPNIFEELELDATLLLTDSPNAAYDLERLSVPIQGQKTCFGILSVYSLDRQVYSKDDILFLQSAANVLAVAIDRKTAEEKLKSSLQEKEVLLKEIHHRVKNNLQIISSLLELQSSLIDDQSIAKLFEESQHRIESMALLHDKLYRSDDLAHISFSEYLHDLVHNLIESYSDTYKEIRFHLEIDPVSLNIETALPCGMIVNELVANCIQHAFPQSATGDIWVECHKIDTNQVILEVRDNGIGFPPEIDFQDTESLGLRLVCILTRQLGATIELRENNGTLFSLRFSELQYRRRL